jgi:adenylate kinase
MRLIMLSPPGAGKGTHSKQLSAATGIAHISSGDLLRAEIDRGTEMGLRLSEFTTRGDLVPDDLIFDILIPKVVEASRDTGGYVLDGFPRTMPQALRAAQIGIELDLVSDAAVYLTAPDEVLIERLRDRSQRDGRPDDAPEVIRHRLAVFAGQTQPLVDYYRRRGILLELDTDRPEVEVQADLRAQLAARGIPRSRARSASSPRLGTSPALPPLQDS